MARIEHDYHPTRDEQKIKLNVEVSTSIAEWFPIPEPGQVNYEARIRPERIKIPDKVIIGLQDYIRNTVIEGIVGYSEPKLSGIVVGLSGGIDSTTVVKLCQNSLQDEDLFVRGVIMGRGPRGEQGDMNRVEYEDVMYAIQSAQDMGIEYSYVNLSPLLREIYDLFPGVPTWELSGILPRLRSILLYQEADNNNAICAGTTNGSEFILGAFTVGGPAGHFQPFLDFYKSEVYKLAEMVGVPKYIIDRKAAISELGLYEEQLYGASCYILDPILRRLNWQKKSPKKVARELGHDVDWLSRIKEVRIEGEKGRKFPPSFIVGRGYRIRAKPNVKFNRDRYFNNLFD